MFRSVDDLINRLKATGYFIDPILTNVACLASRLLHPLLLKVPAGGGKTTLVNAVLHELSQRRRIVPMIVNDLESRIYQ